MKWEDQEINYATPEGKFMEAFRAEFSLLGYAAKFKKRYLVVGQSRFDELVLKKKLTEKARGARIDHICLKFRLRCGLSPGGGNYPDLGVFNYWSNSESRYAIVSVSPENDWLKIMIVYGEVPNQAQVPTPPSARSCSSR